MSSTTKAQRASRVMRRAIPEVARAVATGKLSVRLADELIHLPKARQKRELEHRLAALEQRERRSKAVAGVIRNYLDSTKQVDLETLRSLIREALLPSGTAGS